MPIFHWLPNYDCREGLLKDVACGITLGCILMGQSLAHATLSKVDVVRGPYSCILPPVMYALFGTCLQASVGTGGLLALLTGTALENLGDIDERDHAAGVLCLLVGLMMALMGLFQLSFLVRFLSRPALSGFITGSALLIIKAMLIPMLGLPKAWENEGYAGLRSNPARLLYFNPATLSVSLVSLIFLLFAKSILPKKLKDLKELIIIIATASFSFFYSKKYGIELAGTIPQGFPTLDWPVHSFHHFHLAKRLMPEAALIALVCFISSFASAKKCGMKGGYQVVAFNELVALGLANIASAFSGGVPTQIGLSRSALAFGMGVKTPLGANIFVAVVVTFGLMLIGPVLELVPSCTLHVIIVNAAIGLFEFSEARTLWSYRKVKKRKDFLIWCVAFVGTVILGAFEGILVSVAISLALAIRQIVNPKLDILGKRQAVCSTLDVATRWVNVRNYPDAKQIPGILVLRLDGPLFYANSERFQDAVAELEMESAQTGNPLMVIILFAASIPWVDSTAVDVLKEMATSFKERQVQFFISGAYGNTRAFLSHVIGENVVNKDLAMSIDDCIDQHNACAGLKSMKIQRKKFPSAHSLPVLSAAAAGPHSA